MTFQTHTQTYRWTDRQKTRWKTDRQTERNESDRVASVVTVVASMFTACKGERSWGRTFSASAAAEI